MRFVIVAIVASFFLGGALLTSRAVSGEAEVETSPAQEPSSSVPAKSQSGSAEQDEEQEKQPDRDYQEEMEDFVPSEKLPADSAISFPVDI